MKAAATAILVLTIGVPIVASECQADPGMPAQQYSALLKEYRVSSGGMREATTDLQRTAAVERLGSSRGSDDQGTTQLAFICGPGCDHPPGPGGDSIDAALEKLLQGVR